LCGTLDDFFDLQRFKLFPAWCLLSKKKELIANFICRFFIWFKTRTQRKATSTILNHHSSIKKNMHYAMRLTTQIAHHFREIHFGKNWWATTAQGGHKGRPYPPTIGYGLCSGCCRPFLFCQYYNLWIGIVKIFG